MLFDLSRNLVNTIYYQTDQYGASVDLADPTRVFSGFLEYKMDYSKPLNPSSGTPGVNL